MKYNLRDYQQEASNIGVHTLRTSDKPFVLVLATGAGKSLVIADICRKLNDHVLILQPSKELLTQNYDKMLSYGIEDVKIYSASLNKKEIGKYVMATIGSIYRKPSLFKHFKYIIIDEADAINPDSKSGMYQKFFKAINCQHILGLTATPYRMVTEYEVENQNLYASNCIRIVTEIGKPSFWSGGIVYKIETNELIQKKYLSPIKYRADTNNLHTLVLNSTGTEFTAKSVEEWGSTKIKRIADYVQYADMHCQRNLVFCTSIDQVEKLEKVLTLRGVRCVTVTSNTPTKDRDNSVKAFKNGSVRHMLNCSVFLAGFDVPELDCIIFAKPTLSPRVWYQAIGRGLRLDPARNDKVLRVFDLSGTLSRIGSVESLLVSKDAITNQNALFGAVGRLDGKKTYRYFVKKLRSGHATN